MLGRHSDSPFLATCSWILTIMLVLSEGVAAKYSGRWKRNHPCWRHNHRIFQRLHVKKGKVRVMWEGCLSIGWGWAGFGSDSASQPQTTTRWGHQRQHIDRPDHARTGSTGCPVPSDTVDFHQMDTERISRWMRGWRSNGNGCSPHSVTRDSLTDFMSASAE